MVAVMTDEAVCRRYNLCTSRGPILEVQRGGELPVCASCG